MGRSELLILACGIAGAMGHWAHAAGVPCYYIDESLDPKGRIIRHDPDGTRHVLADGDKGVILDSFLP